MDTALPRSAQPANQHPWSRCPLCVAPPPEAPTRHRPVSAAQLRKMAHLYSCEGRSTYVIAAMTGLNRQRVARLLARAGIRLRPQGAEGRRPQFRAKEPVHLPALLSTLYCELGLSSTAIGRLLDMPPRTVRARLTEAGIPRRAPGNRPRSDRRTLAGADLDALYVRAGLSADEVARLLGSSRSVVLRNVHDAGLPARLGGPAPRRGPDQIELINALYDDEQVAATLSRHGVPRRAPGGRLWERFPEPIALTKALLDDLYSDCGVSITHIELLTGRPVPTIRRALVDAGIPLRAPGGRCPFLRRWRAIAPGQSHGRAGFTRRAPGPYP